jgi:hypothetical protein
MKRAADVSVLKREEVTASDFEQEFMIIAHQFVPERRDMGE